MSTQQKSKRDYFFRDLNKLYVIYESIFSQNDIIQNQSDFQQNDISYKPHILQIITDKKADDEDSGCLPTNMLHI